MTDWAREYFERGYAQRWGLPQISENVRREAVALSDLLHLAPGSRVIDIGCGHGRHALALAERGHEVIGIDFAASLLTRARSFASDLGIRAHWIRGDMRRLPVQSSCAEAASVIDAFGFFETDQQNEAVLQEVARVLSDTGRLALKVVNGGRVLDTFRETDREERDGIVVAISRTLAHQPARMTERISISGVRGQGEYERRQRLYRVDELRATIERVGFQVTGVFASPDGAEFEPGASSTMWIAARRNSDV